MTSGKCKRMGCCCFALMLVIASSCAAAENRPNILFIYTDDQSHRTVGCYEEAFDWVQTPNIDRLASEGVRFTRAYIGTSCAASRAAMLTGHLQFGVETMRFVGEYPGSHYDAEQCPFWPRVFREHGYVTAQIGKWHTGNDSGYGRDWDYQAVWNRPAHPDNAGNYYDDQLIEINGKTHRVKGYATDNYTQWAEEFIRGKHRQDDKPWYLWLCYTAVHGPFTPAQRHVNAYLNATVPVPADIYPPRRGKPAYMQKIQSWVKSSAGQPVMRGGGFTAATVAGKGLYGNTLADWVRQYHQGVSAIDEGVGRLIRALEETGQRKDTLVVFTSDQGFAWGQHGFKLKIAPYDANLRVPLIISHPGRVPQETVCCTPVSGVDLPPTFFRFAGIALPWEMHGHDLTPLMDDPQASWPHPVLLTQSHIRFGSDSDTLPVDEKEMYSSGVPWWIFLVKGRYKYIRTLIQDQIEELYDLESDPQELHNLAANPGHTARLRQFRLETINELRQKGAGIVDNLPRIKSAF